MTNRNIRNKGTKREKAVYMHNSVFYIYSKVSSQ